MVLKQIIESIGLKCILVESGAQAIEAIHRETFDIVLMDVHMPEMSGDLATQKIRELNDQIKQPWIVALSASDESNDKENCLKAGVDSYVLKPITTEKLHELLFYYSQNNQRNVA